jgi:isopentenyl diphosphate isomerase/L-lactate dehydrogenase-like FMN-dependent dehydrogenase
LPAGPILLWLASFFPYGLGTDGKKGVHCIANILAEEVEIAMGLIGKTEPIANVLNNIVA